MKKILLLLFTILLTGCGAEQITGTFTLDAAQGYVSHTDFETPTKYIIEQNQEKVYVPVNNKGLTDEELDAWDDMSLEEKEELMVSSLLVEDPTYDITFIEATTDEIVLEYEGKRVHFTGESESHFITDEGIRYVIQYDSPTIAQYRNSLSVQ